MFLEENLLELASYYVKCFCFAGVIIMISTDEKNLGSENIKFPYRKPTQVGRSSRPR